MEGVNLGVRSNIYIHFQQVMKFRRTGLLKSSIELPATDAFSF
jgi:hypothetical protein